jgi:hypothetical protein
LNKLIELVLFVSKNPSLDFKIRNRVLRTNSFPVERIMTIRAIYKL